MYKIDLNSDLGESFGNYRIGEDEKILEHISSANIACGWHAGDPTVMEKTVKLAVKNNVKVGAHPGFLDKMSFGRRKISVIPEDLKTYIKYQIGALMAFCQSNGIKLQHVKPHGAMYNMAAENKDLAEAIAKGVYEVDENIILMGLAKSELIKAGEKIGLKVAREMFGDRAYNEDGTLVSRSKENAVLHDTDLVVNRILEMIENNRVKSINGKWINIRGDSICVHGDTKEAVEFVSKIKKKLRKNKVAIRPLSEIINKKNTERIL